MLTNESLLKSVTAIQWHRFDFEFGGDRDINI